MCLVDNFDNMSYSQKKLKTELSTDYCIDKQNGLVQCDGCHDKDCPLIKNKGE